MWREISQSKSRHQDVVNCCMERRIPCIDPDDGGMTHLPCRCMASENPGECSCMKLILQNFCIFTDKKLNSILVCRHAEISMCELTVSYHVSKKCISFNTKFAVLIFILQKEISTDYSLFFSILPKKKTNVFCVVLVVFVKFLICNKISNYIYWRCWKDRFMRFFIVNKEKRHLKIYCSRYRTYCTMIKKKTKFS